MVCFYLWYTFTVQLFISPPLPLDLILGLKLFTRLKQMSFNCLMSKAIWTSKESMTVSLSLNLLGEFSCYNNCRCSLITSLHKKIIRVISYYLFIMTTSKSVLKHDGYTSSLCLSVTVYKDDQWLYIKTISDCI